MFWLLGFRVLGFQHVDDGGQGWARAHVGYCGIAAYSNPDPGTLYTLHRKARACVPSRLFPMVHSSQLEL